MAIKKIQMKPEGVNDYGDVLHPETSADMVLDTASKVLMLPAERTKLSVVMPIAGGTFTGIVKAQSNTSYTVAQTHNLILSPNDAVLADMVDGDIWIKYV